MVKKKRETKTHTEVIVALSGISIKNKTKEDDLYQSQ